MDGIGGGGSVIGGRGAVSNDNYVNLPPAIYAATGRETNLYWANVARGGLVPNIGFAINPGYGSKGAIYDECWRFTPTDADIPSGTTNEIAIAIESFIGTSRVASTPVKLRIAKSTAAPASVHPGSNMLTNPGMESDPLSVWVPQVGGTVVRITTDYHLGVASLQVGTGTAWASCEYKHGGTGFNLPVADNTSYTLTFWSKKGTARGKYVVRYYNGSAAVYWNGSAWSTNSASHDMSDAAGWQLNTHTFTTPANGTPNWSGKIDIWFGQPNATASNNFFVDDTFLAPTATKPSRKMLFIGDSTGLGPLGELKKLFAADTVMDIIMVGNRWGGEGAAATIADSASATQTVAHENYSGLRWDALLGATFNSDANPFYNAGVFDFANYLTTQSITLETGDWVLIHLGINDVSIDNYDDSPFEFSATTTAAIDAIIGGTGTPTAGSIRAASSGYRIGICLPIPPAGQDGAGANYGTNIPRLKYVTRLAKLREWLIARYGNLEASNIYIVPLHCNFDTVHNMPYASAANVSARNTTQVTRQNNLVHPASQGYYQMADTLYSFLKYHQ